MVLTVVCPGCTTSIDGKGKADGSLLDKLTTAPVGDGAAALRTTVSIDEPPLANVVGINASDVIAAWPEGVTVTMAVRVELPYEAVTTTGVETPMVPTVTVVLALVWPGWTTRVCGNGSANGTVLDKLTDAPAGDGAGPLKVKVIVTEPPAAIVAGLIVKELSVGPAS